MINITYTLNNFDPIKAADGALCMMLTSSNAEKYYTVEALSRQGSDTNTSYTRNTIIKGMGKCKVKNYKYYFASDSNTYIFDQEGKPLDSVSKSEDYVLKLVTLNSNNDSGNLKLGDTGGVATSRLKRKIKIKTNDKGEATITTPIEKADETMLLDSMTVRDTFAVEALRGIMAHIEDPASLSDVDMNYYCSMAYQWASNMMCLAANTRATLEFETASEEKEGEGDGEGDGEGGEGEEETPEEQQSRAEALLKALYNSTVTTKQSTGLLTSVTERLLNNMVASLDRPQLLEKKDNQYIWSERVAIPNLIEWLDNYTKASSESSSDDETEEGDGSDIAGGSSGGGRKARSTKSTVGLYDLILAVQDIATAISEQNQTAMDNRIKEWLQHTTITKSGDDYVLTVPDSI